MENAYRASRVSPVRHQLLRVEVRFDCLGDVQLEYAAPASEARHFAAAMIRRGYQVLVDGKVRRELSPLPCRRLWRYG